MTEDFAVGCSTILAHAPGKEITSDFCCVEEVQLVGGRADNVVVGMFQGIVY